MKRPLLTSALLFAALTGAFFAFSATADEMPQVPAVSVPVIVSSDLARARTWKVQVPTLGELAPVEGIDVATKCAGRVRSIHFESGQEIESGELLVQLDDAAERARIQTLRARLVQARADLALEPQPSEHDATVREIESLTAELEEQQQLADDKRILAPFSGRLGMRAVHVGQYLEAGAPLASLRKIAPIHVELTLPEQRYGAVAPGARIEVRVGSMPKRTFIGTVAEVEPWIDPATRSFRLRGVLANADGALRPGMLASVSVVLKEAREVVTIPSSAVQRSGYGSTVFVIEEPVDGSESSLCVTRRYLKLGERRGSDVAVLGGLEPGTRVVVASEQELADGARVLVATPVGVP